MIPNVQSGELLQIDRGQCIACAVCVDVCPTVALKMDSGDLCPTVRVNLCTGCALCEKECPTAAIIVNHARWSQTP